MSKRAVAVPYVLRIHRPGGGEEILSLGLESITLGRANINTVVLHDALASRFHARITYENGEYLLADRGSKNGTQVDGVDIQAHRLGAGDVIRLGDTRLVFEEADADEVDDETAARSLQLDEVNSAATLARIEDLLATAGEGLGVLDEIALLLRSVVACDRASVILLEERTHNPLMRYSRGGTNAGNAGDGTDDQALRAGMTADGPISMSVPRANTVLDQTLGVSRHVLVVPLRGEDRKLGLVVLEREPFRSHFGAEDLRLASIAGTHVTQFLRRAL
jgi:pSer/pThr/pTyr-binding forkhead associated (FHA) protein